MNILLASTGNNIGGEETFTRNLALSLLSRGHRVWVAVGGKVPGEDSIRRNIPIADMDIKGRGLISLLKGAREIRKFIREFNIDIVHCQAVGPAIMGGIILKLRWNQGEKWFYHGHGINKYTYKWLPFILNIFDLSITVSDFELIKLKSNGVKDSKIVRVHNGIDPKIFGFEQKEKDINNSKIRTELGIDKNEYIVGYIGRLSPEKGCDLIIPAIKCVLEKKKLIRLVIVGDGVMKNIMKHEVEKSNIGKQVIFTGFRSDIPKVLCCFDSLILPSYMETFSLTTLQAMGVGIPVIASDTGGNPEQVVPNFNGVLFKVGDYIDLSDKIIDIIDNENSIKLGNNGKELIKKYLNEDRMVDEIEFYYKR